MLVFTKPIYTYLQFEEKNIHIGLLSYKILFKVKPCSVGSTVDTQTHSVSSMLSDEEAYHNHQLLKDTGQNEVKQTRAIISGSAHLSNKATSFLSLRPSFSIAQHIPAFITMSYVATKFEDQWE